MNEWIFNAPWWLPSGIAVIGLIVLFTGLRRLEPKLRNAGAAILLFGVAWFLLSYFIETDIEKCEHRTRDIVAAVAKQDWNKLSTMLDADTSLVIPQSRLPIGNSGGKEMIIAGAQVTASQVGLKSVHIISMEASRDQTVITVSFSAYSVQDATQDEPYPSSWQFTWQQRGKDWYLQEITPIKVGRENFGQ